MRTPFATVAVTLLCLNVLSIVPSLADPVKVTASNYGIETSLLPLLQFTRPMASPENASTSQTVQKTMQRTGLFGVSYAYGGTFGQDTTGASLRAISPADGSTSPPVPVSDFGALIDYSGADFGGTPVFADGHYGFAFDASAHILYTQKLTYPASGPATLSLYATNVLTGKVSGPLPDSTPGYAYLGVDLKIGLFGVSYAYGGTFGQDTTGASLRAISPADGSTSPPVPVSDFGALIDYSGADFGGTPVFADGHYGFAFDASAHILYTQKLTYPASGPATLSLYATNVLTGKVSGPLPDSTPGYAYLGVDSKIGLFGVSYAYGGTFGQDTTGASLRAISPADGSTSPPVPVSDFGALIDYSGADFGGTPVFADGHYGFAFDASAHILYTQKLTYPASGPATLSLYATNVLTGKVSGPLPDSTPGYAYLGVDGLVLGVDVSTGSPYLPNGPRCTISNTSDL